MNAVALILINPKFGAVYRQKVVVRPIVAILTLGTERQHPIIRISPAERKSGGAVKLHTTAAVCNANEINEGKIVL